MRLLVRTMRMVRLRVPVNNDAKELGLVHVHTFKIQPEQAQYQKVLKR